MSSDPNASLVDSTNDRLIPTSELPLTDVGDVTPSSRSSVNDTSVTSGELPHLAAENIGTALAVQAGRGGN